MRIEKFYLVENQFGEPCVDSDGTMLHSVKKLADKHAAANRKQFQEVYTVATFERVSDWPNRATGDASARAAAKLIGVTTVKPRAKRLGAKL